MNLIPHSFNRYDLSHEENTSGHILTLSNQAVIQNLIAEKAEAKLSLALDPKNIESYIQEESYLKGQIDVLTYLLNMSAYSVDITTSSLNQSGE